MISRRTDQTYSDYTRLNAHLLFAMLVFFFSDRSLLPQSKHASTANCRNSPLCVIPTARSRETSATKRWFDKPTLKAICASRSQKPSESTLRSSIIMMQSANEILIIAKSPLKLFRRSFCKLHPPWWLTCCSPLLSYCSLVVVRNLPPASMESSAWGWPYARPCCV